MLKKIISLMLVACMVLSVAITASAAGVKPAEGESPITITSAKCVGRTVTVEYTIDESAKFDTSKDVTVLFYSPVGPEGEKEYITYNDENAIYYADQVDYDGSNKLVFALPGNLEAGSNYNVLVGGSDIDVPAKANVELPKAFMYGDIDENETINATDALIVAKYSVGIEDTSTNSTIFNPEKSYLVEAADVDSNKTVNATDALNIAKYAVGDPAAKAMIDALNK